VLQALITAQKWLLAQQFLQGIAAVGQTNGDAPPTAAVAAVVTPLQHSLIQAAVQVMTYYTIMDSAGH
jgi:hypothetical protein